MPETKVAVVTPEVKADRAAQDRAAFTKATGTAVAPAAPAAPAAEPAPVSRKVPPEVIWREGQIAKDKAAARAAAAKPAEVDPTKDEARERDDGGKFKPKAQAADANEDQAEEDAGAFEEAKNALRAVGFRNKQFATMDREEILRKGSKQLRIKEANDEAHRIRKELQEQRKGQESDTGKETGRAKAALPTPPDRSKLANALKEKLGLDDEGASTLAGQIDEYAKQHGEAAAAPLRNELAEIREKAKAEGEQAGAQILSDARSKIVGEYPDLSDPETFSSVVEEMNAIGNSRKYQRYATPLEKFTACMRDSCQNLKLTSEESDSQVQTDATARRYARTSVDGNQRAPAATQKQADYEHFEEVMGKHGLI